MTHSARDRLPPTGAGRRRAFTLVEALTSMTITAVAGSALLLGIAAAIDTTQAAEEQTIALGLAQQLMDELAGLPYCEPGTGPYQAVLGPESGESGGDRSRYDDLDDFHGLVQQPPLDLWGVPLGADNGAGGTRHPAFAAPPGAFSAWRTEVEVYYVSNSDLATRLAQGVTSNHRAVQVRVLANPPGQGSRSIIELRRVFAYVPTN
jgi:type II secretory pathway pseudopilin PulG